MQTDGNDEANMRFCDYVNAPEVEYEPRFYSNIYSMYVNCVIQTL